jgi:AcrR family transcriptional regulator
MPRIIDHDGYRRELLSRCFHLFAERGYAGFTMREIAKGLGVSTGSLYHYFRGKKALFDQLVEYSSAREVERVTAELERVESRERRLELLLRHVAQHEDDFARRFLLLADHCRAHRAERQSRRDALVEARDRYIEGLVRVLNVEPAVARFILVFINGIIFRRIFDAKHTSFEEQASLLLDLLRQTRRNVSSRESRGTARIPLRGKGG